jgi:hypothetical protein
MRHCVEGVRSSGSAANPGSVCGALWYHKMSPAQKRAALRKEGVRGNPDISQVPLSGGEKAVLWGGGVGLLFAIAWWAFKPAKQ